jgi:hypothetical protein
MDELMLDQLLEHLLYFNLSTAINSISASIAIILDQRHFVYGE